MWSGDSLESLSKRGSGTVALPGFTTVDLDTALVVRTHHKFVVAVRVCTPGETRPIAVERPAERWESRAVAKEGQSFMRSADGDPWYDLADDAENADANVCLKAYAGR